MLHKGLTDARSPRDLAILVYENANPIGPKIHCDWSPLRERCYIFQSRLGFDLLHHGGAFLAHG